MLDQIKLRTLYAAYLLAPASFVWWHIDRLDHHTRVALATLFG